MAGTNQLCTFALEGFLLGVEVRNVQEVLRYQDMTRVPLAPPAVRGLLNLRGRIVPALDLRNRLGMPPSASNTPPMNVVVRTAGGTVSLLVDSVGDVHEVAEADFERPPETLRGPSRSLIRGAYKLRDRLLLLLDVDKAAAASNALV